MKKVIDQPAWIDLFRLKKGDLIQISAERWAKVLAVPFAFPWATATVLIDRGWPIHIDSGWPIHRDQITAIAKQPKRKRKREVGDA